MTLSGRAELRLTEHAALWNAHPDSRLLLSAGGYLNALVFTRRHRWTPAQRKLMSRIYRHLTRHLVRGA